MFVQIFRLLFFYCSICLFLFLSSESTLRSLHNNLCKIWNLQVFFPSLGYPGFRQCDILSTVKCFTEIKCFNINEVHFVIFFYGSNFCVVTNNTANPKQGHEKFLLFSSKFYSFIFYIYVCDVF